MAYIKSIQIGKIAQLIKDDKIFTKNCKSAFNKNEYFQRVFVKLDGIQGDEIADTKHHGGREKAVFANSFEHYESWEKFLKLHRLPFGALGENLTISQLDETNVCVGDIHEISKTILQVSQPRKPCFKISQRWQNEHFTKEIFQSKKSGWYYRVLKTGYINQNDTIRIVKKDELNLSIYEINSAFCDPKSVDKSFFEKFFALTSISKNWHEDMRKRVENIYNFGYMKP